MSGHNEKERNGKPGEPPGRKRHLYDSLAANE